MPGQIVYIVCAEGDERFAELLADPLREAGYTVTHNGTIAVGESLVGEAERALASGQPIVLCATVKAMGSAWSHKIIQAAHGSGSRPVRVFIVKMETQAYVDELALGTRVAMYCDDPATALSGLTEALAKHFPALHVTPPEPQTLAPAADRPFLDQLTEATNFDIEAIDRFRSELRLEFSKKFPSSLSHIEFLEEASVLVQGRLTRTGVLLFGRNPTARCPTAIVICTHYYGTDRSAARDPVTLDSTVPVQIIEARKFITDLVGIGEAPSGGQAQSEILYSYPMIAVREVIANALVHRDYEQLDSCVHVRLFDDRLEITSPGSWLGFDLDADVEYNLAALQSQSRKRNFHLAYMLSGIRLVEGDGSGIPSAIRDCQDTDAPAPIVRAEDHFVHVIFRRKDPGTIRQVGIRRPSTTTTPAVDDRSPQFIDREDELDNLIRNLTNESGQHFWLLVAPPGLGKSRLLEELSRRLTSLVPDRWSVREVDIRDQPADVRQDATALLARLLGVPVSEAVKQDGLRDIARDVIKSHSLNLCLLDSAELLEDDTSRTLRAQLSQIYRIVQQAGDYNSRVAFVVASQHDHQWRGISPSPRFAIMPLTEFTIEVVDDAVAALAVQMGRVFDPVARLRNATFLHHLSEGVPALLASSLQWIQAEEWLSPERLASDELFDELATPYIKRQLLSLDGLLPLHRDQNSESHQARQALEEAFRVLAPYRLFTQSHIRHHLDTDAAFADAAAIIGWSLEDLVRAISDTALLHRPLDEPWQEIDPAIRRLLYRHYYRSAQHRADSHLEARQFVEAWAEKQLGKEQVVGLIECLWHQAAALSFNNASGIDEALTDYCRNLSRSLRPSALYTVEELRRYAAERMIEDAELQGLLGPSSGVFDQLVAVVVSPEATS